MGRSAKVVTRAQELAKTLGAVEGWRAAEREFSHLAPGTLKFAFKIYSRLVTKG
jgi:hypothetical protein